MAYEKTTWVDGETEIDAQKLNKMEEGIVEASQTGGILTGSIVAYDGDTIPEGYEEVDNPNIYSTEEYFTGKYWHNGKKIYGKVITKIITAISTSQYTFIDLPSNIEKVVLRYAEVYINSTDNTLILPYVFSDGKHLRVNSLTTSHISIDNPSSYEGTGLFIVEYIKTTD